MPRKKTPTPTTVQTNQPSAAMLRQQLVELEQQIERTAAEERKRRGDLMNEYLESPQGDRLRTVLVDLVAPGDRYLFGFDDQGGTVRDQQSPS